LGALGLFVNMIILWNTLYINAALEQLTAEGYPVQPDDAARLSPLGFEHINLLGPIGTLCLLGSRLCGAGATSAASQSR
jgi:hypothetical protein